jgi:hypothetical protein
MYQKKEFLYVVLSTVILGVLAIAVAAIIKYYSVSGVDFYTDEITIINYNNGKERLRANESGEFIGPKADRFFPVYENDTLVRYRLDGKYGFVNVITGEEIVSSNQHNFKYAWSFDHQSGLAAVLADDKIGFITRSGEIRFPPQYSAKSQTISEFDCEFMDGYCKVPLKNRKYGLINVKNELVLSGYDSIEDPEFGYRVIVKGENYGLADSAGHIVLAPSVDELTLAPFGVIISDAGKRSLYAFDCKTVISDHVYDGISPVENLDEDDPEEELHPYSTVKSGDMMGLIDNRTGSLLIAPIYDDIQFLSDKVFSVSLDDMYYLMDDKGKFIKNHIPEE